LLSHLIRNTLSSCNLGPRIQMPTRTWISAVIPREGLSAATSHACFQHHQTAMTCPTLRRRAKTAIPFHPWLPLLTDSPIYSTVEAVTRARPPRTICTCPRRAHPESPIAHGGHRQVMALTKIFTHFIHLVFDVSTEFCREESNDCNLFFSF
jgi:hypothetical protein